ncbi:hypothetical protein V6N13_124316 [Hibiscus sabdariffa]
MSRQRQRVLPRQKSRLEFRSRQSVFCVTGLSLSPNNYLSCFVLLAAETLLLPIPKRGDYSDPIASLIEFPSLPRLRISADVRFSADVFSAHFWVFSLGVASVQLPSLRASRHLSVAKGFRQIHGIDYDETFSPVAMIKSIRILLAVDAFHDYKIWQMDVKTAFLNGKLEEDVYMTQPEGFVTPKNAGKVCKLQRSIYGLKQASRSWNFRFNEAIQEFGFIRNEDEPCVYKKFSGSIVSFLILYVDDILIIGNDIPTLQYIKTWLNSCFSMKDLGEAAYILGVKIYRDRSRRLLGLSQSTYIDKVLKRFSMEKSKRGFLPMRHGISLSKEMCPSTPQERERMSQIPYASAIGSIMYAMICTRPDLSYALSMTSRYQANPGEGHWTAVKNILKYLRRTKDVFLVYGGEEELRIKGYTDASFQTDKDDSRSQSASEEAKEAVWIKKFITELGVIPSISDAVDLYCDNNGAIAQAKEPRSHQRSKHILRRFHLIQEIIDRGDVEICKVHTDDNIADPLTKPLAQQKHDRHTESLGIRYVSDWS